MLPFSLSRKVPIGRAKSPSGGWWLSKRRSNGADHLTAAGTLKTPNSRSWTDEEERHLKEVVEECVAEGLAGEPLWKAAHPKLLARGVNRPSGRHEDALVPWSSSSRPRSMSVVRRIENKLITALQGPKVNKDPGAPKKGRFKGKGHAWARCFGNRKQPHSQVTTGDITPSDLRTAPLRKMPLFSSFNSNFDVDMRDLRAGQSRIALQATTPDMSDPGHDIRRRARSV